MASSGSDGTKERDSRAELDPEQLRGEGVAALCGSIPGAALVYDPGADAVLAATDDAGELFGAPVADLRGLPVDAILETGPELVGGPADAGEGFASAFADAVDGMERSVTTTGEIERVVRISATSVVLDGRALAVVTLEDRTADRELAETLEEVERHLDTVTTNLPALLFTIESDGVVSHIEGSGLARLGQEPGDLVGVNLFERFGDERTVTGSVRRAMRGESVEAVVELGGTPFQAWFRPVYDDGTVDRVVGMALDVTDQRRRQQLLEVFNRVLRHNLRNELNVVLGAARNARSRGAAPEVETCLDQVVGAAERLLRTGEKAHPLAAIERETDDPAVRDLRRVVMAACRTVAERFPDAELETDLPDHPVRVRARGIERAVTELLDNAVRHNDATGPRAAVTVALGGSERGAELSVVDDGPGLSSMEQSVLSRGRETPLHHSEGLGLWLVSWVLMSAGGEFSVDSSDGGTTVTVELPALDDN